MAKTIARPRRRKKKKKNDDSLMEEVVPVSFELVVSTGSTLLDLAISGKRIRGGGIPGGIIGEISGPSGAGKTALLSEASASCQIRGGEAQFLDPEARLDKEYSRIYGLDLKDTEYKRPNTVNELFEIIWNWEPEDNDYINLIAADSLTALSTEMELKDGDKYGMKRAKEFSEGLRKTCRQIANNNWIILCTNQEREGPTGITTPGGKGIPYYSSLRIRITPMYPAGKIKRSRKIGSKNVEKVIGVSSICEIKKSSIDEPFRRAPVYILFGLGIDDVRGNLQWYKDMTGETSYYGGKKLIEKAIKYVEEDNLENDLREKVIDLWEEVEEKFRITRKQKRRF